MMYYLYSICYLFVMQTSVTPGTAADGAATGSVATNVADAGGTAAANTPPSFLESMQFFLPAMIAVMLVYFIMMARPKKADAQSSQRLKDLKKNDRVVTAGGILGTVVNIRPDSEYTTIRIDESSNTKMQILSASIVRVLSDESENGVGKEKSS